MARKKKYPKLPNGYGSIKRLSGKNRRNPYGVYPPTKEFNENGIPVHQKAICYVDDWYKGFTVLTWYKNGEYYDGREKELSGESDKLNDLVLTILSKFSQTQRELVDSKTFTDVFLDYYKWKFGHEYDSKEKKVQMEYSIRSAYKNSQALHDLHFRNITTSDLQDVIDCCPFKHSTQELIKVLFKQVYAYAEANDLADKDYSKFVRINSEEDDEHGVPFTVEDLKKLWKNKNDSVVEMLLIMCYSGFRISEYLTLETNIEEQYFKGGIKTNAGKNRIVPIHSGIISLVEHRMCSIGKYINSDADFRTKMYETLDKLGIEKHTPHDCRHTFSMLCEKYGVRDNDRKRMLGHSFQDVTNKVYGHRDIDDLRKEIEKIKICH